MLGRLVGYMSNRQDRLETALRNESDVIDIPATDEPAGYGLGFYQGGEVLHKKRPLLDGSELDWAQLARDVRTDCALFHWRRGTVGAFRIDNTHPFRMRSWLFAHNGTIEPFEQIRDSILEQIPDFIRRNLRGQTDSEHLFHLILSFLHDCGQLDVHTVDDQQILSSLRSALGMVDRLSDEAGCEPAAMNFVLTNGEHMYAVRRGRPMMYTTNSENGDARDPSNFRYALLVGGVETVPDNYRIVENHSVAVVDRDLNVSVERL